MGPVVVVTPPTYAGARPDPPAVPRLRDVEGDASATDPLTVSQRWWDEIWRWQLGGDRRSLDRSVRPSHGNGQREGGAGGVPEAPLGVPTCPVRRHVDRRSRRGRRQGLDAGNDKGINRETGERSVVTWLLVQRIENGRIAEHGGHRASSGQADRLVLQAALGKLHGHELATVLAQVRRNAPVTRITTAPMRPASARA